MSTTVDTSAELTVQQFQRDFLDNLRAVRGVDLDAASLVDCYHALANTVRRYLLPRALDTRRAQVDAQGKWAYYLSAEYLLGRQLDNNLLSADLTAIARQALAGVGLNLDELREVEIEPGLGNGGLGRLAACFLDSAATLNLPAVGYGIRYEYGIFRQTFVDGWQVERPDEWMLLGNPWELPHPELAVTVGFGGQVEAYTDDGGRYRIRWRPARTVLGIPYYYLVPGYRSGTINSLRLWSAQATEAFNLQIFNRGDYTRAVQDKIASETISKVLYPVDETPQGRQLRLEQQYFFVACSLRDILRRLPDDVALDQLSERVVIQLNDTHPTVAVPELMRLLVDEYLLPWERAWEITRNVFAYTCHTLMPEALEKWPLTLFEQVLPRHLQIIYEINQRFLDDLRRRFGGDERRVQRMSLIEEYPERQVRMAHLAAVGSFKINGVAMKFALNGALTIGTLDGANIDIRELVSAENFFLFGLSEEQITATRAAGYDPRQYYAANPALMQVIDQIAAGAFSPNEPDLFRPIVDSLLNHDEYLLLAEYQSYVERQDEVEQAYRDEERWTRMSILNTARCGYFSSDRSIRDYAEQIWQVRPVDVAAWRQARATRPDEDGRRTAEVAGIDLSDGEWQQLVEVPTTISDVMLAVTDSGLIGTVLEEGAGSQAPAAAARRYATNPLIKAVLRQMRGF